MHDAVCRLPRIPLLGTSVNKLRQVRRASIHGIMVASKEEEDEPWLIGIANTVGPNCLRTTTSLSQLRRDIRPG